MPDVHVKLSAAHCCNQHCKCNVRPQVWQTNRFKRTNGKLLIRVQFFKVFSKLAACLIFMPKEYMSSSAEVCSESLCCWAPPCLVRLMTGSNTQVNSVMQTEEHAMLRKSVVMTNTNSEKSSVGVLYLSRNIQGLPLISVPRSAVAMTGFC